MKCEYVLKNQYSDSISVKKKKSIDDHIMACSFCQEQIVANDHVSELLKVIKSAEVSDTRMAELLQGVRRYRERKQSAWWRSLLDFLPVEPFPRKTAIVGITCCVMMFLFTIVYFPLFTVDHPVEEISVGEIEFYLQEHALAQDADLFGKSAISNVFVSLRSSRNRVPVPDN